MTLELQALVLDSAEGVYRLLETIRTSTDTDVIREARADLLQFEGALAYLAAQEGLHAHQITPLGPQEIS